MPLPETGADYKRQYTLSCGKLSTYYAQVTLLYPGAHLHPKQGASRLSKTRQGLPPKLLLSGVRSDVHSYIADRY